MSTVRYTRPWQRVCVRHGRWLLDADAGQGLEFFNLGQVPEVVMAGRRWPRAARRAVRSGAEPERVLALARAVVCRWWDQALYWEREEIWPDRLHRLADGDAGGGLERWRALGRDAAVFPEVVAVAEALLDPAMAELAWAGSGADRPRPLPADGAFCRELGRVARTRLAAYRAAGAAGFALPERPMPEVLGVDDFALRRRHRYGTVVTCARTRARIDVLPDCEGTTLEAWLRERPGAMAVCRDGSATHAAAMRLAAEPPGLLGKRAVGRCDQPRRRASGSDAAT